MMACDVLWDSGEVPAFRMLERLRELEDEDPALHVSAEGERLSVRVSGRLQTEVLASLAAERWGQRIAFGPARVLYRETVAAPAIGIGHYEPLRHYAEVHLLLEPLPPGSGLSFDSICPEDVLDRMADNPKVCRYMDIPLQHIADGVLDKMHRYVDGAWTRALIAKMRARVPGVVLRTTMIVGHPGEGKRAFEELLSFVEEARFERLGAFTYSEEEGTYGAENYRDRVPAKEKRERLNRLMEAQSKISYAFNASRVGTVTRVLADSYSDGVLVCRSEFESPEVDGEILVRGPEKLVGTFFDVKITGADEYDLVAELVQ
jgi:hypothetical protein